jgi:hypothetical protein
MKFLTGGEAERGECLAEHALRLANLPLRVVLNGGPVQDISEGPRERRDLEGFVCDEIELLRAGGDRMVAAPKHVSSNEDARQRRLP